MKDVKLPLNSPTQLFLDKHGDFIAAYGKKKDDYVSNIFYVMASVMSENWCPQISFLS